MYFDYSQYYRGCLTVSVFGILFVLALLIPNVLYYIRLIFRKKFSLQLNVYCLC